MTRDGERTRSAHGRGRWDRRSRLAVAVLVDVDGTLAAPYRDSGREIRADAVAALSRLARHAPVFLWSVVGADNGNRLLDEYPALRAGVSGSFAKDDFPLHLVDRAYAIDDLDCDEAVLRCHALYLVDTYFGGGDDGLLTRVVDQIIAEIRSRVPDR